MHDEVLLLFDDCIAHLLVLRANLSANRPVRPGERHATVLSAIEVAERFAASATRAVAVSEPATVSAHRLASWSPSPPLSTSSAGSSPPSAG